LATDRDFAGLREVIGSGALIVAAGGAESTAARRESLIAMQVL
jgi:hypothetical protein